MTLSDLNDLDFSNAGAWPLSVKIIALVLIMAAVGAAGYWFDVKELWEKYEKVQQTEQELRTEFEAKQKVVANIEAYRERLATLREMLAEVLKQLPTRTEMPDLLDAISDTGKINGLNFTLFRPESERPRDFYAEVPISIQATASYHQFSSFVSSISALDRIVTLESARLAESGAGRRGFISSPGDINNDNLQIQATLQTYRYLEEDEQAK